MSSFLREDELLLRRKFSENSRENGPYVRSVAERWLARSANMLTTAFVVVLRPFQLLLSCSALVMASLDQFYQDTTSWIWILLALILPSTLLTISVAVHTTFAYYHHHVLQSWALTLRWLLDFVILALMAAAMPLLFANQAQFTYRLTPPAPFITIVLIILSLNMALFMATTIMLAIEDYAHKTADRLDDEDLPRLGHIEHTTHTEAILGPRPDVAPKEIAYVVSRPASDEPISTRNHHFPRHMSRPTISSMISIGGPKHDFWNV